MIFKSMLYSAVLDKRYKRFLADVRPQEALSSLLENTDLFTVHCPNTGAMTGCAEPGDIVWLSDSNNSKRKYRFTWELVQTATGDIACVNTAQPNQLVKEAVEQGLLKVFEGYHSIRSEVKYGNEGSRIDLLLDGHPVDTRPCYIEVKNVTLANGIGTSLAEPSVGAFPDAKTERGQKHLRELIAVAESGMRAVLVFCVSHSGIKTVLPADKIDPVYGQLLREAVAKGVEVMAYPVAFEIVPASHKSMAQVTMKLNADLKIPVLMDQK